ncbi:MAG: hypothetical protein R3E53_10935 [Myxococcota bacterium]
MPRQVTIDELASPVGVPRLERELRDGELHAVLSLEERLASDHVPGPALAHQPTRTNAHGTDPHLRLEMAVPGGHPRPGGWTVVAHVSQHAGRLVGRVAGRRDECEAELVGLVLEMPTQPHPVDVGIRLRAEALVEQLMSQQHVRGLVTEQERELRLVLEFDEQARRDQDRPVRKGEGVALDGGIDARRERRRRRRELRDQTRDDPGQITIEGVILDESVLLDDPGEGLVGLPREPLFLRTRGLPCTRGVEPGRDLGDGRRHVTAALEKGARDDEGHQEHIATCAAERTPHRSGQTRRSPGIAPMGVP